MPTSGLKGPIRAKLPKEGGMTLFAGHMEGAGAAAPTLDASSSHGVTVSRSSQGVYVITLPGKGAIKFAHIGVQLIGNAADHLLVTSFSEAARTVTLKLDEDPEGVPQVDDLEATEFISFLIIVDER